MISSLRTIRGLAALQALRARIPGDGPAARALVTATELDAIIDDFRAEILPMCNACGSETNQYIACGHCGACVYCLPSAPCALHRTGAGADALGAHDGGIIL